MDTPVSINFEQLTWQPHPTIAGIEIKLLQNDTGFSPTDVLIATVAEQGEIPWHVHETDSEIAYVVQGTGTLYCAADESHKSATETAMTAGNAVIVPPGLWHSVHNIGDGDLLIFAAHTPQSAQPDRNDSVPHTQPNNHERDWIDR